MQKIKLFCFPYAGGSATVYHRWRMFAGSAVELVPVELAGRGRRIREPFYQNLSEAVEDVHSRIASQTDEPYAFYGHSMGGAIALELCRKIALSQQKEPIHLFVSGRCPPSSEKTMKPLHSLPFHEFKKEVLSMGGTENGFFENEELLDLFLPILRNDFKLIDQYDNGAHEQRDFKTSCDITAFAGREDDMATGFDMRGWSEHTRGRAEIYEYGGGHFFIHDHAPEIMEIVNRTLSGVLSPI